MSKKSKQKTIVQAEKKVPKNKVNLTLILGIAFVLFFTLVYPIFTPILTKYTVVKHISDKGETIKDFQISEVTFSKEKSFYIVTLTHKTTGQKRELGISSKFLPTTVEYDIEP